MRGPRLPARLRALAELLPDGAVADVGAGHGALAVHLARRGRRVIATEAQLGPYAELCANVAAWGAKREVDCRLGRDLDPLAAGEVDGAVLAGMGARTVIGALARARDLRLRWAAFQCWQRVGLVEPWLAATGWTVRATAAPFDGGRAYPTWVVEVR